nr:MULTISPECIES: HD domain-containing protein [unclassified Ruminococcus]
MLNDNGFDAYAVGGCVRDCLIGIKPKDFDVTTNALPYEIKRVFAECKTVDNGIKHGTVAVIIDGEKIEVTSYRSDGEYLDCRRPESVSFGVSLDTDLMRRDFTVNAMAYSDKTGVVDLFGGKADIKNKIIRCVGNPDKRFSEDALRILRALRFAAVYGFSIEAKTAASIHRSKHLLKKIAAERIFAELSKLVCGKAAGNILLSFCDVFGEFIPVLLECRNLYLSGENHRQTLLEHTARAVDSVSPKPELRLAMLLHDIAKPQCNTLDSDGNQVFYSHARLSASIAREIMKKLKAPSRLISQLEILIEYHDYACAPCESEVKRLMRKIGRENALLIFSEIRYADITAQNGAEKAKRLERVLQCAEIARRLIDENACVYVSQLEINGSDIIKLGIKQGRGVGEILEHLLDLVIDGKLENERQVLIQAVNYEYL